MKKYEVITLAITMFIFGTCYMTGMILDALPETHFNGTDLIVLLSLTTTTFSTTLVGLISYFKFLRSGKENNI